MKLSFLLPQIIVLSFVSASAFAQDTETLCNDKIDNDKDSMVDCADADCFDAPECKTSGGLENTDQLCTDFIDNDGDGAVDCEDVDCQAPSVKACRGSWEGPVGGTGAKAPAPRDPSAPVDDTFRLGDGMSVEDLIGTGDDIDGERNNFACSDGIDNDGDGRVDCADIGCRFDPNVTACRGTPGLRFSVAANVMQSYTITNADGVSSDQWDTRFRRLQLRTFGPLPGIQDSFFLISMLVERTPRVTFAMFSFPIYKGHKININSGGGGLSNALILSVAKNPLLDPPFYVYSAFEAGNGAAMEFSGPILPGRLDYRVFGAGGGGRFNGNLGGRFLNFDELNYAWGVGGQVAWYITGRFDRWDSRYLYTPVPLGMSLYLGARYDQREFDRYPAVNLNYLFRWKIFQASLEAYGKRELEFGAWQGSLNAMASILIWPKHLFLAADIGLFRAGDFETAPIGDAMNELTRVPDESGARAALHWYVYRNTGLLSLLYRWQERERALRDEPSTEVHEVRAEVQIRF